MGDIEYWDIQGGQGLSDDDLHNLYDDMLNEVYGEVHIGYSFFAPAEILKHFEPVTYRIGFNEWLDSELGETITEDEPEDEEV